MRGLFAFPLLSWSPVPELRMRYHYEKPAMSVAVFGEIYRCNHPVYAACTLFRMEEGDRGLAVIQQPFDEHTKHTWWGPLDPWLANDLYLHPAFREYFDRRAEYCSDGLYPTVSVRQIMWALKMKPLRKARWETVFDRRDI